MQVAPIDSAQIERWRQVIKADTLAHYHYHMGVALTRSGNDGAAEAQYERVLSILPGHAAARLRLLTLLEAQVERRERAQILLAEGARLDPHFQAAGSLSCLADDLSPATAAGLAGPLQELARADGIADTLRGEVLRKLAANLTAVEEFNQAETALEQARQALPKDVGILSDLAAVQLRLGRIDHLSETLTAWLALVPADPEALFYRARFNLLRNEFNAGDDDLKAALAAGHPNPALILSFRIRGRLAAGDPAGAIALYDASGNAGRDSMVCRAYARIALLRLDGTEDDSADDKNWLNHHTPHPLICVVGSLIQQKRGGDWRQPLANLLRDRPSAFCFAAAAVLDANTGASPAAAWRKALSFGDPYAAFYVRCLSAQPELILAAADT